jgi:tetratricopeptide (TPR) repeat protein
LRDIWHIQCERGDQAEIERNYPRSEFWFRQALKIAEQFGDTSKEMQTSIARLATILVLRGEFEAAEKYYQRLFVLIDSIRKHGEPDPDSLVWMDDLRDAYQQMSKRMPEKAIFCLEHCVAIRNKIAPGCHPKEAATCSELSSIYMRIGRYAEAENILQLQLGCQQNIPQDKSLLYAPFCNLALAQEKQKKYEQAKLNFTKAIAMLTQSGAGPEAIGVLKKSLQRVQAESSGAKTKR